MPAQETKVGLFRKPRSIPLDRVLAEPATALLVAGIVNPFGPTLTAVIVPGKLKAGNKLSVFQLMLNPFSQEAATVGQLVLGDTWRLAAIIRPFLRLPFGGCPTLLLPSVYLDDNDSVALHAEFLRGFADARDVLQRVRQYLGNPWDRVSQEMNSAFTQALEYMEKAGKRMSPEKTPAVAGVPQSAAGASFEPLNEAEARELAGLLLSEQHAGPELEAFLYAWRESIAFQREHGFQPIADAAMSLKTFQDIFKRFAPSCRIPKVGAPAPPNPFTKLRETAEIAFHQGYKVRNKAKTEEALTILLLQLSELLGASPEFFQLFEVLDSVKRAVEVEDWESGTAPLLALLAFLREAEAAINNKQR